MERLITAQRLEETEPEHARAVIAAAYLGSTDEDSRLGAIRLQPHQVEAIGRLRSAIAEFGGALLCDPVGTGKTFVALALGRSYKQVLVVGPAVLRPMWAHASEKACVPIRFVSHESLSRGMLEEARCDFVIVDEAHHARNPRTRRFAELSHVASGHDVVLLSATPIHNRRGDVVHLLSIFLGDQSSDLTNSELGRCVVRREAVLSPARLGMPCVEPLHWKSIPCADSLAEAVLSLPPPLPPRDGGAGGVLIVHSLVRQWASSDAALRGGLIRRKQRAIALLSALEAGTYPSRSELAAWSVAEDSVQLAFAELMATPIMETRDLIAAVRTHHTAVSALLERLKRDGARDRARAMTIREIRERHAGVSIVAFSQYDDTVSAMFELLAANGGVAALTGRGGRVASGRISRADTLARFAPEATGHSPPSRAETVSLLITTDLLSEGVNLQDAGVVIHLDLPWTPARMEQRLGRIARIGSRHATVNSYAIHPPASVEAVARLEATLERKMRSAEVLVGDFPSLARPPLHQSRKSEPELVEALRERLSLWVRDERRDEGGLAAAVTSETPGFLAAYRSTHGVALIGSLDGAVSEHPLTLIKCAEIAENPATSIDSEVLRKAIAQLDSHLLAATALGSARHHAGMVDLRRSILRRSAAAVRRARPHERMRILALAQTARRAAIARLGAHVERELAAASSHLLPDDRWLESVVSSISGVRASSGRSTAIPHEIIAMIVFDRPIR